jgi:hypothetical protein
MSPDPYYIFDLPGITVLKKNQIQVRKGRKIKMSKFVKKRIHHEIIIV